MTDGRRVDYERLEPPSDQKCLTIIVRAANMARAQHYPQDDPQVIAQSTSHNLSLSSPFTFYLYFYVLQPPKQGKRESGYMYNVHVC